MPAYIVLGMHRSGTSVVAGMLDTMGVRMGPKDLRPGWVGRHWSNPMGHFENPDFVWLNARILGYDGAGVHESPAWDQIHDRARALRSEIERTVRAAEGDVWGWKDPWSVLTVEEFLPTVHDPRLIFIHRDPLEVAGSLYRRDHTGPDESRRIAARFATRLGDIATHHPDLPHLELSFDVVTKNPTHAIEQLATFAGIQPTIDQRRAAALLVVDEAALRSLGRRLAQRELATYPKWVAWLVARDLRLGRRDVGALWRNASHELSGAYRAAI